MSNNKARQAILYGVAILVGPLAAWQVYGHIGKSQQMTPYLLETETTIYGKGIQPVVTSEVAGGTSEGSRVVRRPDVDPNGENYEVRYITLAKEGVGYHLHSGVKSVSTSWMTSEEMRYLSKPRPRCGLPASAEEGEILGVQVLKLAREANGEAGGKKIEAWLAPSLGCHPLHIKVWQQGMLDAETKVKWVKLEAPPPEYFVVPAGYKEMMPSETAAAIALRYGGMGLDAAAAERFDERYLKRARAPE